MSVGVCVFLIRHAVCVFIKEMLPSLSYLRACNVPKSTPVATPGRDLGRGKSAVVPRNQLNFFVDFTVAEYLYNRWKGLDENSPILFLILASEYDSKWSRFISGIDYGWDVEWVVHDYIDADKFKDMMSEYFEDWESLNTKAKIDEKIVEFYKSLSKKIERLPRRD